MKRRMISLVAALALVLGLGCAGAEGEQAVTPEMYQVTEAASGMLCDLNGDGTPEAITYEVTGDGSTSTLTLTVGEQQTTLEGWDLHDTLYLLRMEDTTFLLAYDYGPSDDPDTHFLYLDAQGTICDAGSIYADPRDLTVSNGIITAKAVRGQLVYTWFHEGDFALATSILEDAPQYTVVSLPRPFYAMGLTVKAQQEIPLQASPTSSEVVCTIAAGELVVLSGSDDVEWVYLATVDGSNGGWLRMKDSLNALVGGEEVPSYLLFDGLIMAD